MELVLVDSSTWINLLKDRETASSVYLRENADNLVITTCPVIVQEVLQGVKNERDFNLLKQRFDDLFHLPTPDLYLFAVQAAAIFRSLRQKGVTIRKPNDCLIAYYAIQNAIPLLADDADFIHIARHTSLNVMGIPKPAI